MPHHLQNLVSMLLSMLVLVYEAALYRAW